MVRDMGYLTLKHIHSEGNKDTDIHGYHPMRYGVFLKAHRLESTRICRISQNHTDSN